MKYYEKKKRKNVSNEGSTNETDDEFNYDDDLSSQTIPMVLIVVQGGPNTLLTVEESIKQNIPVLILAVG